MITYRRSCTCGAFIVTPHEHVAKYWFDTMHNKVPGIEHKEIVDIFEELIKTEVYDD